MVRVGPVPSAPSGPCGRAERDATGGSRGPITALRPRSAPRWARLRDGYGAVTARIASASSCSPTTASKELVMVPLASTTNIQGSVGIP